DRIRMHDHLAGPGRRRLWYVHDLHLPNSPSHHSKHGNNLEDLVNWLHDRKPPRLVSSRKGEGIAPPSIRTTAPVMKLAAGEPSIRARPLTSSVSAIRPTGIRPPRILSIR